MSSTILAGSQTLDMDVPISQIKIWRLKKVKWLISSHKAN